MKNVTDYALKVADGVAGKLGWSIGEAINVVGDTAEYEAEGLTIEEAVSATLDAIAASA